jgi:hypothetical protein
MFVLLLLRVTLRVSYPGVAVFSQGVPCSSIWLVAHAELQGTAPVGVLALQPALLDSNRAATEVATCAESAV